MGTGYKGGSTTYHSIQDNMSSLTSNYPYNYETGYFGDKGQTKNNNIRNIVSTNPIETAKNFYNTAAYGGIEHNLPNNNGVRATLKDGTILIYRTTSSSDGSPAVSIDINRSTDSGSLKSQKIHFTLKEV